jgi:CubicO group peptidase (beta-lactamase class C family)
MGRLTVQHLEGEMTDKEALHETIRASMERHAVPGVAVGIYDGGEENTEGFGVTSVENPLPVDPDTLFQIGSITKTVTATAIVFLAERGMLDLEEPVRTYLPELRLAEEEVARKVTTAHLLTHVGGWVGDLFEDTGCGDDALEKIVRRLANAPQLTPLGELWSYNNSGFCIAGRVVEVVSGEAFETAVRELVLAPLGMDGSFFFPGEVMTRRFAMGHLVREGEPSVSRPWALPRNFAPAGGLASSAKDQVRYARFHLGVPGGTEILGEGPLRRMRRARVSGEGDDEQGLAWMLSAVGGLRFVAHGGDTNGQNSVFWMVSEKDFAFVVLTNADRGDLVCKEVSRWVRREFLGVQEQEPEPMEVPEAELEEYAGRYVLGGTGDAIDLRVEGVALRFEEAYGDRSTISETEPEPPPPARARFYARDRIILVDGPQKGERAEFLHSPEGRISWLRRGRVYARQDG